jgi:aryl-alcohol dehydrogenase-like predicted oxidoreductase
MANNNLRQLGKDGPQVPRVGLGCVPLGGGAYGLAASDEDRLKFLDEAYEIGARFWDCGKLFSPIDRLPFLTPRSRRVRRR